MTSILLVDDIFVHKNVTQGFKRDLQRFFAEATNRQIRPVINFAAGYSSAVDMITHLDELDVVATDGHIPANDPDPFEQKYVNRNTKAWTDLFQDSAITQRGIRVVLTSGNTMNPHILRMKNQQHPALAAYVVKPYSTDVLFSSIDYARNFEIGFDQPRLFAE